MNILCNTRARPPLKQLSMCPYRDCRNGSTKINLNILVHSPEVCTPLQLYLFMLRKNVFTGRRYIVTTDKFITLLHSYLSSVTTCCWNIEFYLKKKELTNYIL